MSGIPRPVIAITMGDPHGIGAEIVVKTLARRDIYKLARPLVVGCQVVVGKALQFLSSSLTLRAIHDPSEADFRHGTIDLLDLGNYAFDTPRYGRVSATAGQAAVEYILTSIALALRKQVVAVVTGPICKEAVHRAGYTYSGHTEIFAEKTGSREYAMVLVAGNLRVIHVSTHVRLREACDLVKRERVLAVIRLAAEFLTNLGIEEPRIGVAGLNPHSGEGGLFGTEETAEIAPAVDAACSGGLKVRGPLPADSLFARVQRGEFHIAVAMYHDQGHIPVKTVGFQSPAGENGEAAVGGVNITAGLPVVRTSVDHGVAFDLAGRGEASPASMIEAVRMAVVMSKNRKGW